MISKTAKESLQSSTPSECIKASGKTVKFKALDRLFIRTELGIKETFYKVKNMEWVFWSFLMELYMRAPSVKTLCTVMGL